ncbi:hypothetical protein GCM10023322_71900 [Rugosimonospora acidiphila]|uniref:Uncharacterized protein n=1 Tax=Rugosimonospora acidiphila TaxID=556531 RepID=A0ABP9SNK9_9ACTN
MADVDRQVIEFATSQVSRGAWIVAAVSVVFYTGGAVVFFATPSHRGLGAVWAMVAAGWLVALVTRGGGRWVRRGRPVRVGPAGLEVPGVDGVPVAIDWADLASADIVGEPLSPRLVVVPTSPGRLRPAPDPWATRGRIAGRDLPDRRSPRPGPVAPRPTARRVDRAPARGDRPAARGG